MALDCKCNAEGCERHSDGPRCGSVSDWMERNPGWLWILDFGACSRILCEQHAKEAMELAAKLVKLAGEYSVPPMLKEREES